MATSPLSDAFPIPYAAMIWALSLPANVTTAGEPFSPLAAKVAYR